MTNTGKLVKSNDKSGFGMMQIQSSRTLNVKLIEIKSLEEYEVEYLNQIISLSVTYPIWSISKGLINYVYLHIIHSLFSVDV